MKHARWPRLALCASCGSEILVARFEGSRRQLRLEPMPVLAGRHPCPRCRGKGHTRVAMHARGGKIGSVGPGDLAGVMGKGTRTSCPDCGGTGCRGENLTNDHVVMSALGVVRDVEPPMLVMAWDSAYRRHVC